MAAYELTEAQRIADAKRAHDAVNVYGNAPAGDFTPSPSHVEHSLAVVLLLEDGLSQHRIETGLRLTHTELRNSGGFDGLREGLRVLVNQIWKTVQETEL